MGKTLAARSRFDERAPDRSGFARAGQDAAVKVETFTRYGLPREHVVDVSRDRVEDSSTSGSRQASPSEVGERTAADGPAKGPGYVAHVALDSMRLLVDGRGETLAPGMAGIKTGSRRVIAYLLSPLQRYAHEGEESGENEIQSKEVREMKISNPNIFLSASIAIIGLRPFMFYFWIHDYETSILQWCLLIPGSVIVLIVSMFRGQWIVVFLSIAALIFGVSVSRDSEASRFIQHLGFRTKIALSASYVERCDVQQYLEDDKVEKIGHCETISMLPYWAGNHHDIFLDTSGQVALPAELRSDGWKRSFPRLPGFETFTRHKFLTIHLYGPFYDVWTDINDGDLS
jgi:hypothetical protein